MRPFFRFVAKSGATELITAVGLFIILAVVLLMDTLGISTTLGAFLTGVLLADSEFRHELEASIAPFKGLLLGLFFMTVGMTTQLSLLIEMPWLIIGGAIGLLVIKTLVLTAIARYKSTVGTIACYSGLAWLKAVNSLCNFEPSKSEKILTDALLEPVTLIVTLSMVLTPVIYWIMACKIIPFS